MFIVHRDDMINVLWTTRRNRYHANKIFADHELTYLMKVQYELKVLCSWRDSRIPQDKVEILVKNYENILSDVYIVENLLVEYRLKAIENDELKLKLALKALKRFMPDAKRSTNKFNESVNLYKMQGIRTNRKPYHITKEENNDQE